MTSPTSSAAAPSSSVRADPPTDLANGSCKRARLEHVESSPIPPSGVEKDGQRTVVQVASSSSPLVPKQHKQKRSKAPSSTTKAKAKNTNLTVTTTFSVHPNPNPDAVSLASSNNNTPISATTQQKQPKKPPSLVDFRSNKLVLKQKKLPLDRQPSTMREQLAFQSFLDSLDSATVLEKFPEEHLPLVAKYAHESEKSLLELAKQVKPLLKPQIDDVQDGKAASDPVPHSIIQNAISQVATRVNYGLEPADFQLLGYNPDEITVPNSLCIWRWEARDPNHLPKELIEKIKKRAEDRSNARQTAKEVVLSLGKPVLDDIFAKGKAATISATVAKEALNSISKKIAATSSSAGASQSKSSLTTSASTAESSNGNNATTIATSSSAKKPTSSSASKKAAAAAATASETSPPKPKEAGMFASFFKPKASASPEAKTSEKNKSDFDKVFKPFHVKSNVITAPINTFLARRYNDTPKISFSEPLFESRPDLTREEALSSIPKRTAAPRSKTPFTGIEPRLCVRDTMQEINEGILMGVDSKHGWNTLKDVRKVPIKLLKFQEDVRPGYVGTWSKSSNIIGPRRPFARETSGVLNYEYDSEAEWEDVGEGEDVADDKSEDEDMDDDDDDDDDGFFCGDDEIEMMDGYEDQDAAAAATTTGAGVLENEDPYLLPSTKQMQLAQNKKATNKKRTMVGPLVPVQVGPVLENTIADTMPTLEPFRIQFLNDSKPGLNPFTFVSNPPKIVKKKPQNTQNNNNTSASCSNSNSNSNNNSNNKPNKSHGAQPDSSHVSSSHAKHQRISIKA